MFLQHALRRPAPVRASIIAIVSVLAFALAGAARAGQPSTASLNPQPPDFYICAATGGGTICRAHTVDPYEFEATGIFCGTGADLVEILDSGIRDVTATRWYDGDGNLTRRQRMFLFRDAYLTNPATGQVLPYSQLNADNEILGVPGDLDSATLKSDGHLSITAPGFGIVLSDTGRTVFGPNGDVVAKSGLSLFDADSLCAALGTPNG